MIYNKVKEKRKRKKEENKRYRLREGAGDGLIRIIYILRAAELLLAGLGFF
jgi:hypothetical protein